MNACFIAYIVQAIINNFVPLLFLRFQEGYGIPLSKITLLVTVNFGIQLAVDLASAGFVDRIGYRASMLIAHICAAAGLLSLTVLPEAFSDPFVGLLLSVIIYAVGGGLLEVLVSPVMESCPTENKEKAMSLLHSFYCWGHVAVVLISTVFFRIFGISNWKILAIGWAARSAGKSFSVRKSADCFSDERRRTGAYAPRAFVSKNILGIPADDGLRRGQRAVRQPVGVCFRGKGARCRQNSRRSCRSDGICGTDGNFQSILRKVRR